MKVAAKAAAVVVGAAVILIALLFFIQKEDRLHVLYATAGDKFDSAAYGDLRQSLTANADTVQRSLDGLSLRRLKSYDAVYLDPALAGSGTIGKHKADLIEYVRSGGHLFLENGFAADFPLDFLGASSMVDLPAVQTLPLEYPKVDADLNDLQQMVRSFTDAFNQNIGMNGIPGFRLGKGLVPAGATPIATLQGATVMAVNRYGEGSVLFCSSFLPNRYFITGFDLLSGQDPKQGFDQLVKSSKPDPDGGTYFNKQLYATEPYFHFTFASGNYKLRTEFLNYVSKVKFGYSVEKALGPYGRPAMAFQNHFEAAPAIRDKEGIKWTELLKTYNEIPSFTLVRMPFYWWQWQERVIVHLNDGTQEKPHFIGEYANSAYTSGAHLIGGDSPITLAPYPEIKQLSDPIPLPYRAYPALADLNGDGRADLILGSADGTVRVAMNEGPGGDAYLSQAIPKGLVAPDKFAKPVPATLPTGETLSVGSYSAVAAADLDGDGLIDLVLGDATGNVRWARGIDPKAGRFAAPATLATLGGGGAAVKVPSYAAPFVGDVNGDGVPDLLVGDGDGRVHAYAGTRTAAGGLAFGAGTVLLETGERFAAPAVRDMNGDGRPDLVAGGDEGDIVVFLQRADGGWDKQDPLEGDTLNQVGNHVLVGGHNSVPLWYDINHDGKDDLVVGELDYGGAVPIDSPDFRYAAQLKEFIQYSKNNKLELFPHVFVHSFLSDAQEKNELALHRKAFETLGIPWTEPGANQHTWRINHPDRLQTLQNENAQDIWYNFGFRPAYEAHEPHGGGGDYTWALPFLLEDPKLKGPMLLDAPVPVLRATGPSSNAGLFRQMAELDMPINYFEHIEYMFPPTQDEPGNWVESRPARYESNKSFAEFFDRLRTEYDYNFMTEHQMASSFLTAIQGRVHVGSSWAAYLWNRFKDRLGKGEHLSVTLTADTSDVPSQAGDYRQTLGVIIKPGARFASQPLDVDSPVYAKRGGTLYAGLVGKTTLSIAWQKEPFHIVRSNVPFKLQQKDGVRTVELNGDGMQQLKVYSPTPLHIEGEDLKVDGNAGDGTYTITHFGAATRVTLRPQ